MFIPSVIFVFGQSGSVGCPPSTSYGLPCHCHSSHARQSFSRVLPTLCKSWNWKYLFKNTLKRQTWCYNLWDHIYFVFIRTHQ